MASVWGLQRRFLVKAQGYSGRYSGLFDGQSYGASRLR